MKKILFLICALFFSQPAFAAVVTITVSSGADNNTGSCDDARLSSNQVSCTTLRKAIDYINDGTHCTRLGEAAESLSYVINLSTSVSIQVPNNISDRNNPNASLDNNSTGDFDIAFACHTPITGELPYVTIQATSLVTIDANNINNSMDPDRIFDVHQGKIHFKNINIRGGMLKSLPDPNICNTNNNLLGAGLLIRPAAEVILQHSKVTGSKVLCGSGGGIANLGKLGVIDSEISANAASLGNTGNYSVADQVTMHGGAIEKYSNSSGGGIYNAGELYLVNSSVNNNRAGRFGGGLFNYSGKAFLNNTTLAENEAVGTFTLKHSMNGTGANFPMGTGGGVFNTNQAKMVILNSTIAKNKAFYAAGISNGASATYGFDENANVSAGTFLKIGNSLIAENKIAGTSTIGVNSSTLSGSQLPPGVTQESVGAAPLPGDTISNCWGRLDGEQNKISSLSNNLFGSTREADPECSNSIKNASLSFGALDTFSHRTSDTTFLQGCSNFAGEFTYSCRPALMNNYSAPAAIRWVSYAPMVPFDQRGISRIAPYDRGSREEGSTAAWLGNDSTRDNQMLSYPGSPALGVLFEELPASTSDIEPTASPLLALGGAFRSLNIENNSINRVNLGLIIAAFNVWCSYDNADPSLATCSYCQISPTNVSRGTTPLGVCARYGQVCQNKTVSACRAQYDSILGSSRSSTPPPSTPTPPAEEMRNMSDEVDKNSNTDTAKNTNNNGKNTGTSRSTSSILTEITPLDGLQINPSEVIGAGSGAGGTSTTPILNSGTTVTLGAGVNALLLTQNSVIANYRTLCGELNTDTCPVNINCQISGRNIDQCLDIVSRYATLCGLNDPQVCTYNIQHNIPPRTSIEESQGIPTPPRSDTGTTPGTDTGTGTTPPPPPDPIMGTPGPTSTTTPTGTGTTPPAIDVGSNVAPTGGGLGNNNNSSADPVDGNIGGASSGGGCSLALGSSSNVASVLNFIPLLMGLFLRLRKK